MIEPFKPSLLIQLNDRINKVIAMKTGILYTFLNLVILVVFTMVSARQLQLSETEIIDYLADTGISLVFIGLLAYNIFKINERSLEKATMDIQERKKAEEALAQSEKKFSEMLTRYLVILNRNF